MPSLVVQQPKAPVSLVSAQVQLHGASEAMHAQGNHHLENLSCIVGRSHAVPVSGVLGSPVDLVAQRWRSAAVSYSCVQGNNCTPG